MNEDIYDMEFVDLMMENDELDDWEQCFMSGYLEN